MASLLQKLRFPAVILSGVLFISWSFVSNLKRNAVEDMYTLQDYLQDSSKIYFDLGRAAQNRGDYENAIKFYRIVLNHKPDHTEAHHNLTLCAAPTKKQTTSKNVIASSFSNSF